MKEKNESVMAQAQNRDKEIIKTSVVGILGNILLVIAKAIVGFIAGSVSVVLDALNNLTDALSSLITIIGTKLSGKRPDKKHPYGYGRIEYVTSIVIAALVLFAGGSALYESIETIIDSVKGVAEVHYTYVSIIVVAIAIVGKIGLGLYFRIQAKKTGSENLKASGTDALMDALLSTTTLIGILVAMFASVQIEGYLGVVISLFILKVGIEILVDALNKIVGERADPEITKTLRKELMQYPSVLGVYDIIINSYGENKTIASAHIEVPDEMTALEIHRLTRTMTIDALKNHNIILTLGIYASNTSDPTSRQIRDDLLSITKSYPCVLQVHGFYVDEKNKVITFDLILDFKEEHPEQIEKEIAEKIKKLHPEYNYIPILDQDFSDR